jgi:hypothetical protein
MKILAIRGCKLASERLVLAPFAIGALDGARGDA